LVKNIPVKIIPVGMLDTNCYIVGDPETKEGVVIDPGAEGDRIKAAVESLGLDVKYIINTHGHHDHIGANFIIKRAFGAPLAIHRDDASMLKDPLLNLSFKKDREEISGLEADMLLEDGDEIAVGRLAFKVLHTPGHTQGSICLLAEREVFTGDTLFAGSVGRTDLPGGSYEQLMESISTKLKPLPGELTVYPGHGPSSTMSVEKEDNPFLA